MLKDPSIKYQPSYKINFPERTWVNKTITQAPIWLSTDLRDGNQSLFNPMNIETKMKFYNEIIRIGFKEIEIGFPAASEIDYNFARKLIEENKIPDDVTIMVMTQARKDLIKKTVESLKGAKKAIIHIYNATAKTWRETVFGMTVSQVMELIETHISYLKELTDQHPETQWILQYSPETFSSTEPEVALEACNTAIKAWKTSSTRSMIINLPTTVENTTPNVFADYIEWMNINIADRENIIISVHPHNDRGTGVATAELSLLAGADRIEGCIFGNGERSGNVDIATIALNLYTQGISPNLDFSNINHIAKIVEKCTQIPIHPRHPYVGDLVFTAFSGSHQDAIKKGFAAQKTEQYWKVPYLPIDPTDIGKNHENIIRINSQSGKGGVSYIMEHYYNISMPRRMQIEFSSLLQNIADSSESEMTPENIWTIFNSIYLENNTPDAIKYVHHKYIEGKIELYFMINGVDYKATGNGNGMIEAIINALNKCIDIIHYEEKSIGSGADATAICIIECQSSDGKINKFGVAKHHDITIASIIAIFNAVHRMKLTNHIL
ncbi:MAG: 2-isopropylmalate synthase [Burkholderiales bacterium]|nr:2-isopropylmalate synthase [Burkholderiales bacterium]